MSSFRLQVNEIDKNPTVSPETNNIGATVLPSLKGPEIPVKIERGNTNKILSIFGKPTASNPYIFDAINYNLEAPIWISAPSKNGLYGGVFVTKTGTQAFTSGLSSKANIDFSEIALLEDLGIGDGSTTSFTLNLNDYTHYINQSITIKVNGTTLTGFAASNAATEVLTTSPNVGSGTYVRATGILTFTFVTPPSSSDVITVGYNVNRVNDVYFILFNKNPQVDDIATIVEFDDSNSTFIINLYLKDLTTGAYSNLDNSPYTVSLTEGFLDGFNNNIYIENIFEESDYITPVVNSDLAVTTFQVETDQTQLISIGDGSTVTFTTTLTKASNYVDQSIDITVAGTTINVSATDTDPIETLTTSPDVGGGTYNRDTGVLSFTFDTAPTNNYVINATYKTNEVIDSTQVDFNGGDRGDTITAIDLIRGWDYFKNKNTYPADIFFDTTANPNIPSVFNTLRNTYQKYKAYILPLPQASASASVTTKTSYGISNRGIYYYWNKFRVRNSYNNDTLWTFATGPIAKKHAQMVNVFNGLAPAWIDENGHGGQLDISVVEQAYDPDEDTLKLLDKKHINPIHNDADYGPMIKSHRTSLTLESDYSYISHSRVADYIILNIISQVLPYQYVKLNDTFHRSNVKSKCDTIISPLKPEPYNLLIDFITQCDEKNNNSTVLAQRKFVLTVKVKYTPTSEYVDFNFVNMPSGADITGSGI